MSENRRFFPEVEPGTLAVTTKTDLLKAVYEQVFGDVPIKDETAGQNGKDDLLLALLNRGLETPDKDQDAGLPDSASGNESIAKLVFLEELLQLPRIQETLAAERDLEGEWGEEDHYVP